MSEESEVEEVAKAIHEALYEQGYAPRWCDLSDMEQGLRGGVARAAISKIREMDAAHNAKLEKLYGTYTPPRVET
jgi:hypothetical protein